MNQTLQTILQRRSIKKYKSDPVPKDLIEKIVEAGTYAATGRNLQSPIILAVTNKELRDKLSRINAEVMGASGDPFYGAPCVLVVLADRGVSQNYIYDGSLVMGNLMLAATSLGLGSCWIHRAKETFELPEGKEILKSLGIEGDFVGIGNCVVGYADGEAPAAKPRKAGWVYYVE
ncbi:MAG: nitroreductase [Clostridia bacterium]|nr:nitroreductase [Clostridia bacterium]